MFFGQRDQLGAGPGYLLQFRRRICFRGNTDTPGAALGRQFRQRLQRPPGAAITFQQPVEGNRADILTADQAQPVEPFAIGQRFARAIQNREPQITVTRVPRGRSS